MKIQRMILPAAALGAAAALLVPVERSEAYSLLGFTLAQAQRDFRVWNNFTTPQANSNVTPDPSFPGYLGAVMSIWKGAIEWQSTLHGDGSGDPHQPFGLGSGGANFDPSFQGQATNAGTINENVHSMLTGCQGGVLAFTESPDPFGWRIRYLSCWTWNGGPGFPPSGQIDLQGVAAHEHGHALGMGHTTSSAGQPTMYASIFGTGVVARSIEADDINGIRAAYGTANSATKPRIEDTCVAGTELTVTGANFSPTDNQVWFTQLGTGGNGTPIKVTALPSDGTRIVCTIPSNAGPGDVLVRNNGGAHGNLSNAWPSDLQDTGGNCGGCPDPVNYCVAAPNSAGPGMTIDSQGSTCVSANDFVLWAYGGPPNKPGIFYYGPGQTQVSFGDGFRCVSGSTFRLPLVSIDSFGDATFAADLTVLPFSGGNGAWFPGDTWNCQFWYRDPAAGGAGFNLTDGLEVTLGP